MKIIKREYDLFDVISEDSVISGSKLETKSNLSILGVKPTVIGDIFDYFRFYTSNVIEFNDNRIIRLTHYNLEKTK